MSMAIPITGPNVNLYIPFYQTRLVCDSGIPKIGAGVTVDSAGVDHMKLLTVCGSQLGSGRLLPN